MSDVLNQSRVWRMHLLVMGGGTLMQKGIPGNMSGRLEEEERSEKQDGNENRID